MREIIKVYGPAALLIIVVFAVAIRFIAPPPPKEIRLAAGVADGYYRAIARQYRTALQPEGLKVDIVESEGALDNLHKLLDTTSGVDVALVQGGLATNVNATNLVAIAGIFYEPVWVLVRAGVRANRVSELKGRRIAIGPEGSGTRILAQQLLEANDIHGNSTELLGIGTHAALDALDNAEIEAAFIVTSEPSRQMKDLLARKRIRVLPFEQADAYRMKFPFLTPVQLPMGAVSLPANVPPVNVTLLAPTGMLVARDDIHPALVNLLLSAAHKLESGRQLFAAAGTFPTGKHLDFPLQGDAQRYFDRGPSLLFRYLPFWIAVWIERMTVLVIPILTMLPILRAAPPAYNWQLQRKIYRWYHQLHRLEHSAHEATTKEDRDKIRRELDEIQDRLRSFRMPISYAQQLYDLRGHVDFVRTRLREAPP